jgi:arsenate reductase (thioredoxin)
MNSKGQSLFAAYSAGSHPTGKVRPEALSELQAAQILTTGLRSKSWDEFSKPDAPRMDFIFTVCDNAANEVCPVWPGHPMTAHWDIPDPAAVTEQRKKYKERFGTLSFCSIIESISSCRSLTIQSTDSH